MWAKIDENVGIFSSLHHCSRPSAVTLWDGRTNPILARSPCRNQTNYTSPRRFHNIRSLPPHHLIHCIILIFTIATLRDDSVLTQNSTLYDTIQILHYFSFAFQFPSTFISAAWRPDDFCIISIPYLWEKCGTIQSYLSDRSCKFSPSHFDLVG